MKLATILTVLLLSIAPARGFAQNELFVEALNEYLTDRLWEFEEIPIKWNMEGKLQADLNEGLNNLLEDNLNVAENDLTAVIAKDSSIWQAYYYRAAVEKKLGRRSKAEKDIRQALEIKGDFYEGLVELAKILYLQRQTKESARVLQKAIHMNPSVGTAYYLKGDINWLQKEHKTAINSYRECLNADSMFHNARVKLGLMEVASKNDINGAIIHFNRVLSYDSLQKYALLFRAILGDKIQREQSVKDLTNLLLVSPDNLLALYTRGFMSAQLGDFERAFKDFHKIIQLTATSDNNFIGQQSTLDKKIDLQNLGMYALSRIYGMSEEDRLIVRKAYCQIIIGEHNKSIATLNELPHPNHDPLSVYMKAVAYEHAGQHVQALNFYNLAINLDNQIADAYKKRGVYEQEMQQWAKSISDFNTVLKLNPMAFRVVKMRGVSHYHLKMYTKALEDFNACLKNDSTDQETRSFRGMVYWNLNQPLKAYVDFTVSENYSSVNLKHIEHLVDSVLQQRDTVQAMYSLNVITEAIPYFTEGYVQKFKIHVHRNEWQPIIDDLPKALNNRRSDVSKSNYSYLLTLKGMLYARDNQPGEALKLLDLAIDTYSRNDLAYIERGRILVSAGKLSKGKDDLKKASALGNRQAEAMLAEMVPAD